MSAIDPDCGVNAIVNYTLGDSFAKPQFSVKPDSGDLCVSAPLDYEAHSDFEFPVIATDRGMSTSSYLFCRFWSPFSSTRSCFKLMLLCISIFD